MKLSNNTVLITGGTSGIGFELAKQLLELDNTVIITGRDQDKLNKTKSLLPNVHTIQSDINDPRDIATLYAEVASKFPSLNILVNNAGYSKIFNLNKNSELEELTREVTTNLNAPIWLTQQFLPLLSLQNEAAIINVTSAVGFFPIPTTPIYSATKAGLHSFTISLREQLKYTPIKVFELAPPATQTSLLETFDKQDTDELKPMPVEKLVSFAIKGLKNDTFEIRPGQSNQIYYLSKFYPNLVLKLIGKSLDRLLLAK
nr:SDR family NAD(P)-dependent oxidoreductase [Bacteriovorax sp. HI3]